MMKNLLASGQIREFAEAAAALHLIDDDRIEELINAVVEGDISALNSLNPEFSSFYADILKYAKKSQKEVLSNISDYINGDLSKKYITSDELNIGLLRNLKKLGLVKELGDGIFEVVDNITEKEFNLAVQQALSQGKITSEEAMSLMTGFHENQYKNNTYNVLSNAIKDIDGMNMETAMRLADAMGMDFQQAVNAGYLILNQATGKYEWVDEDALRARILQMLPNEERNDLLAQLDKGSKKSKQFKAWSDAVKNYNKLSEEMVAAIATDLGWSYDTLRTLLIDNGDGTYRMSLTQVKAYAARVYGGENKIPDAIQDQINAGEDRILY